MKEGQGNSFLLSFWVGFQKMRLFLEFGWLSFGISFEWRLFFMISCFLCHSKSSSSSLFFFLRGERAQRYIVVKICTTIVNGKNDYGRLSHTIKQENARFSQPPHSSNPGVLNSITCSNLKSSFTTLYF